MANFLSRWQFRIEWGHCDPAGIVFNSRFFEFFDWGTWTLFGRALDVKPPELTGAFGIVGIPIVDASARFLTPARFGEAVELTSRVSEFRALSFDVEHRLIVREALAVEGRENSHVGDTRSGRSVSDQGTACSGSRHRAPSDAENASGSRSKAPRRRRRCDRAIAERDAAEAERRCRFARTPQTVFPNGVSAIPGREMCSVARRTKRAARALSANDEGRRIAPAPLSVCVQCRRRRQLRILSRTPSIACRKSPWPPVTSAPKRARYFAPSRAAIRNHWPPWCRRFPTTIRAW